MPNVPTEPRRLEFQIRRMPGGICSDGWVFGTLCPGDEVRLSGPFGRFVLQTGRDEPAVHIAGGTGLAQIMSMIRDALEDDAYQGHLILCQGARSRSSLYDVDLFRRLAAEYPDRFPTVPLVRRGGRGLRLRDADRRPRGRPRQPQGADRLRLRAADGGRGHAGAHGQAAVPPRPLPGDFFDASDKATGGLKSPLIKR